MVYHERMKQYYDRLARDYDRSASSREEAAADLPGLLRAISLLPPARVLDVACGTGSLTQHLGPEVTGLDQSEAMLEVARRRTPGADFVRGDALQMPFAEHSFGTLLRQGLLFLFLRSASPFGSGAFPGRGPQGGRRTGADRAHPRMGPEGRTEGWEQRVLPDGSRHEIYRRYFTAESLAAEIDGRVLFAGSWVAMAAVGR